MTDSKARIYTGENWFLNPLSAKCTPHDTLETSESCYENLLTFSCKILKLSTKWYIKLCYLLGPFLRNCVTKSNFWYKKTTKKGSGLFKGLKQDSAVKMLTGENWLAFLDLKIWGTDSKILPDSKTRDEKY